MARPARTPARTPAQPASCDAECPVQRAARVVDGKWTTLIVRDLLHGAQRYSALQRSLTGISPRLLTARLRLLEQEGVLLRTVYPINPPTTDYALTAHGRRLAAVIEAMAAFGRASQRRDRTARPAAPRAPEAGVRTHRLR